VVTAIKTETATAWEKPSVTVKAVTGTVRDGFEVWNSVVMVSYWLRSVGFGSGISSYKFPRRAPKHASFVQ